MNRPHQLPLRQKAHEQPESGLTGGMVALGVLIGAGIVMGLVVDWIRHPDF